MGTEMLNNLSPSAVGALIFALILAAAGAVNTIGSAAEKLIRVLKAAKAPNEEQDARLKQLEADMKDVKKKLEKEHSKFESLDSGTRVTQQALLALLDHGIDGNNTKQLQDAKETLQTYLINRN